jgi:hypothetical protein
MIFTYIFGLLTVNSLLLLWFFSPLKTTIGEIFFKKILMPDEFDDVIFNYNKIIGKLISCWICLSFWLSLVIGIILGIITNVGWHWGVVCFFSYPSVCYVFYKFIKLSR